MKGKGKTIVWDKKTSTMIGYKFYWHHILLESNRLTDKHALYHLT